MCRAGSASDASVTGSPFVDGAGRCSSIVAPSSASQATQLVEHAGAMVLEHVDLVVDLAAPAQALLDGLGRLGCGFLEGVESVVLGLGADLLGLGAGGGADLPRVGLGVRAQLGAVLGGLALELLGLLLGGQQDVGRRLAD
jgi:hypothetical protein